MKCNKKLTIGWCERINLPEWKIKGLRTKIDTGAKTSALDVDHIKLLSKKKVKFCGVTAVAITPGEEQFRLLCNCKSNHDKVGKYCNIF